MQSTMYKAVYIGSPLPGIKPGRLVDVARIEFEGMATGATLALWEVRPRWANAADDWTPVDRLDLVIPGHPTERSMEELRQYLAPR